MHTIAFSAPFTLDRSRQAAIQVYEYLREEILNLVLKPGTVLPRGELTVHFGLSVTPIRDALIRLEEDGLVDIYPQHATRVRGIHLGSARQAHFLRLAIELEVVRELAGRSDAALVQSLRGMLGQQRAALADQDLDAFTRIDQNFHHRLYGAAGVEELWRLMRSRSGNMDRLRRLHLPLNNKAGSVLEDHTDIVDAIGRGDVEGAAAALRRHLSGTLSELDSLQMQYPDYWVPEQDATR